MENLLMKSKELSQAKKLFQELMNDEDRIFLYLREGDRFREVKGKVTEVGNSYIKIDTFKSKQIPLECISPHQLK